jgi:hypothetical protein
VLENHRSVMESKRKLARQHQLGISSRPHVVITSARSVFRPAQSQSQPRPLIARQGFSTS